MTGNLDCTRTCPGLWRDDRGMMTVANCVCVLLCALLIAFTMNTGQVVNQKVECQVAADAAAQSAGIWMARGMNSITATNHLMGEMLSLVILHEAVGGKKQEHGVSADHGTNRSLYAEDPAALMNRDETLRLAYWAARAAGATGLVQPPDDDTFELVYQRSGSQSDILAEATLLDSKMNLKQWLTRTYRGLVIAAALKAFPWTRAAGEALEKAMLLLEKKIDQEYRTLKALHGVADALLPCKLLLRDELLPFAKRYTTRVTRVTPKLAQDAAEATGRRNGCEVTLFPGPGQLELPVEIDPLARTHTLPASATEVTANSSGCGCPSVRTGVTWDQVSKMTQLARASFPWVNYHRKPILKALGGTMHLAESQDIYFHWSNGYSKFIVQEQQVPVGDDPDSHLGLYVLKNGSGPDRGFEPWTIAENSELADDLFTVVALARRPPPAVLGVPVFQQQHPDGIMATAMATLYNANEQQRPESRIDPTCKRIVPPRQANVGMDTLNWYPGSRQDVEGCGPATGEPPVSHPDEHRPFELLGIGIPAEYPRIQVNWQSKLVPVTAYRLGQLKQARLPGPFGAIAGRLPDVVPRSLATH